MLNKGSELIISLNINTMKNNTITLKNRTVIKTLEHFVLQEPSDKQTALSISFNQLSPPVKIRYCFTPY